MTIVENAPTATVYRVLSVWARSIATRLGPLGGTGAVVFLLLAVTALGAPWLSPHDPDLQDLTLPFSGPTSTHLLGTDSTGRDTLSRLIWGARISLGGPALTVTLSLALGIPIGLLAAWRGGRTDAVIARVLEIILSMPGILVAVVAVAIFEPGLEPAVIALAIAYSPYVARTTRAAALTQRHLPYVDALQVQGFGAMHISTRHVLPNIVPVVTAQLPVAFAGALIDLAALSFLGLAVQAPEADWGVLVSDSSALLQGHTEQIAYAGSLIVLTVVALTFFGDSLTRDGRPRTHGRKWRRRHD